MAIPIDLRNYIQGISIPGRRAKLAAQKLTQSAPPDMDEAERSALGVVQQVGSEVSEVLSERDRISPARLKPLLLALSAHWTALFSILEALTTIPARLGDRGERAAALSRSLFPAGVSFARSEAPDAWAEAQRRIDRIVNEKLRDALVGLVGADVLAAAEDATRTLGEAIGAVGAPRAVPSRNALREKRLKFSRAVAAYCRVLSAKLDEADDASVDRFRRAVAPIDELRSLRSTRTDLDEVEDTEVPPAPPAPVVSPTA